MFNLTKGEIYKIIRSKTARVLAIVVCLYSCIDIAVMIYVRNDPKKALGFTGFSEVNGITAILSSTAGELFYIIMGIITAIIVCAEFSTGSIRQIISRGFLRDKVILSKYVALCLINVVYLFCYILFDFIGGCIMGGVGSAPDGFTSRFPLMIAGWIFMILGFVAVAMFLSFLFRSSGISVAINILLITFGSIVAQLLAMLTKKTGFIKYWITCMSNTYTVMETPIKDYLKYFGVYGAMMIIFVAATIILFRKRDIA